jgi:hypothetical protein
MEEHSDVPQDPYADGIAHPLREAPLDVATTPEFPPSEMKPPVEGPIASAEPTTAANGPIGSAPSTCENLSDVSPDAGE